jgi:hypothetical protein
MKVFLSWSGELSRKTAVIFRGWLPSVIQSIDAYVSSEDIDKGARWSSDIAKELDESNFGILCVTKENLNAPWLTFEAGALSKTMLKSSVTPFLLNIRRAEVNGPILQFQSTIFEKDDVKKLVYSLNKAHGENTLPEDRLLSAFELWYPELEKSLNAILQADESAADSGQIEVAVAGDDSSGMLEEILDLARNNQKLLRNPEGEFLKEIEMIRAIVEKLGKRLDAEFEPRRIRRDRKMHPMFIEELMHMSPRFEKNLVGFQISISLFRADFPWIYDAGIELARILRSNPSGSEKHEAIQVFVELVEFTFEHPMMREMYMPDKEMWMIGRELPRILKRALEHVSGGD